MTFSEQVLFSATHRQTLFNFSYYTFRSVWLTDTTFVFGDTENQQMCVFTVELGHFYTS